MEIKANYKKLIKSGFVEVKPFEIGSDEHRLYNNLKNKYNF